MALQGKVPAQDEAEVRVKDRVEAEWVDRMRQVRAEIVSVRNAERRLHMLPDNLVMQKVVLSVVQE